MTKRTKLPDLSRQVTIPNKKDAILSESCIVKDWLGIEEAVSCKKFEQALRELDKSSRPERGGQYVEFDKVRHPRMAYFAAKWGMTKEDTARALGIACKTYVQWLKDYPRLRKAVEKGVEFFHTQVVEKSLTMKAQGYDRHYVEVVIDKEGNRTEYHRTQHYPPDSKAIQFWLRNRCPERWPENSVRSYVGNLFQQKNEIVQNQQKVELSLQEQSDAERSAIVAKTLLDIGALKLPEGETLEYDPGKVKTIRTDLDRPKRTLYPKRERKNGSG